MMKKTMWSVLKTMKTGVLYWYWMHFNHHVMKSMDHFNECVDLYLAAPHRELPTPGRTSICGNLFSFNVSRPRTVGLGLYGFGGQNDKVVQSLFLLVSI